MGGSFICPGSYLSGLSQDAASSWRRRSSERLFRKAVVIRKLESEHNLAIHWCGIRPQFTFVFNEKSGLCL